MNRESSYGILGLAFACAMGGGCEQFSDSPTAGSPKTPAAESSQTPGKPGVAAAPVNEAPPELPPGMDQVLRLDGSNTIGAALAPKLAKAFLEKRGAKDVNVDESQRKSERILVVGTIDGKKTAITIWARGTKHGFETLASGAADVAMASRAIKPDEAATLKGLGDMTSVACEQVIGEDGIAVIVSSSNALTKLSLKDLASVFDGDVQDWSKVGGAAGAIHIYSRDTKSGTYDAFVSTVLKGKSMRSDVSGSFEDSDSVSAAVAKDPAGIGFVGLPYVKSAKALATFEGDASPMYPTVFTVATEDYAITRRLHLYIAEHPKNPLISPFVDFALSEEGQALVEGAGFVSLRVRAESPTLPASAPDKYTKEVKSAQRLSVDFRFKTGSSSLDNKSLKDLDRVVSFLSSKARDKHAVLFGFADNQGGDSVNSDLSKRRADAVSQELKSRGVGAEGVIGLGSALPLASNDTAEGRDRNRRVEIWIR